MLEVSKRGRGSKTNYTLYFTFKKSLIFSSMMLGLTEKSSTTEVVTRLKELGFSQEVTSRFEGRLTTQILSIIPYWYHICVLN